MQSKLAVFYQTVPERNPDNPADSVEIVRASKMLWVKAINPDSWAENPFPEKRILARLWIGGDDKEAAYYRRGAEGAEDYFALLRPRYLKLKELGIMDVAGPNEPQATCSYFEDAKRYISDWYTITLFEKRWAELVGTLGLHPWIFSNSTGTPEMEALIVMLPAFYAAIKAGGGWETHEYGAPGVRNGYGWYVGRIARMLVHLAGLSFPRGILPVFIGEGGIDGGVIPWNDPPWAGKKPRRGWRDWRDWAYTGEDCMGLPDPQGGMTDELYWRHLSWQDDVYCAIPEVVAFTSFVTNPESNWADFTIDGAMVARMAAKFDVEEQEPPLPPVNALEVYLGDQLQAYIIPLNPDAALQKAGRERGLVPASDEVYAMYFDTSYIAQGFRTPENPGVQYIAYCLDDGLFDIRWFTRQN